MLQIVDTRTNWILLLLNCTSKVMTSCFITCRKVSLKPFKLIIWLGLLLLNWILWYYTQLVCIGGSWLTREPMLFITLTLMVSYLTTVSTSRSILLSLTCRRPLLWLRCLWVSLLELQSHICRLLPQKSYNCTKYDWSSCCCLQRCVSWQEFT